MGNGRHAQDRHAFKLLIRDRVKDKAIRASCTTGMHSG